MQTSSTSQRLATTVAIALAGLACPAQAATVLFQDDFSGTTLNSAWRVGTWGLGRTDLNLAPVVSNGYARLSLQTFDVAHPGTRLSGTEMYTQQKFSVGNGLEFSSQMRFSGLPDGVVTSMFTYGNPDGNNNHEIDFEFLSKEINAPHDATPMELTSWKSWRESDGYNNNAHHWSTLAGVAGLDYSQWNTYTVRWLPGETSWLVNGRLVAQTHTAVPDLPMTLNFNFWAPASTWGTAYSASLKPTADLASNQAYSFDVRSVTVTAVPEPGTLWMSCVGAALLLGLRKRRAVGKSGIRQGPSKPPYANDPT